MDEPIELGQNLGFSSLPGDGSVVASRYGDNDLFFGNTDADTDTFVAPLTESVEVFEQIRSPESPEQFRFGLSVPGGAELRSDGFGGAEIVDSSDKRLAFVPAPYAVDAQGTTVPVSMSVDGDAVVVQISHRSFDVAYPILLDPELVLENWTWGSGTSGLDQWAWNETADYENATGCIVTCWGSGLYSRSRGSNYWYGANTYGEWIYTAPNITAYIAGATFLSLRGAVYNCPTYQPHGYVGLYNVYSASFNNLGIYSPLSFSANSYDTGWVGGNGTRKAIVGIGTANAPSQLACGHDFYVGGAMLYQDDPENPVGAVWGMPGGWIAGAPPFTLQIDGHDPGLGVRKISFTRDGSPAIERPVGCNGTAASRCPINRSEYFAISGLSFDEGKKNASATVEDVTGKKWTQTWQTYVDRTKPDLTLSGQLAVATDEDEGDEKDPEKWDELSLPAYNLTMKATDGSSSPDWAKRSGVKKLEVLIDGVKQQAWEQPCSDSCPMEKSYSLKLNNLAAGAHKLKVIATDQVNNAREREIEFEFIPATGMKDEYVMQYFPLPDGEGNEAEEENPNRPELAVNVVNGNLVYREKDVEVEGSSVDLEVERYYNSLLPEGENTEWGDGWTLAQTPELEPEAGPTPTEAMMIRSSGAVEGSVALPTTTGAEKFDPQLQAVVTKEPGGGYEVEDASGETDTALSFDQSGQVEELRTEGEATVDYDYDSGELAEIAVEDPASFGGTPEEAEEAELPAQAPSPIATFGTTGSGNGQFQHGPGGVDRDSQGNFWVADTRNQRIQKFDEDFSYLSQIAKTGAGENHQIYASALAVDSKDNVWIADWGHHRVEVFDKNGAFVRRFGTEGAGSGQFKLPEGIAIDAADNVYVADHGNGRVQKFDKEGKYLKTIGSKGSNPGQLLGPEALDVAPNGNLWVADWSGHMVDVFDPSGNYLFRFGSKGSGEGQFQHPVAISVDYRGRVFVADQVNDRVQQFDQQGDYVRQFGSAGSGEGQFDFVYPADIETDEAGNLWITDANNGRIRQWAMPEEEIVAPIATFGTTGSGNGQFQHGPGGVDRDSQGNFWVADTRNQRIQKFDEDFSYLSQIAKTGAGENHQIYASALAVDSKDNVWIADWGHHRVEVFDKNGAFVRRFGTEGAGSGQFKLPEGIAIDAADNVYVADHGNGRVQKFDKEGKYLKTIGSKGSNPGQLLGPEALDVAPNGNLWVADWSGHMVDVFDPSGNYLFRFGSKGSGEGQFQHPVAISVDYRGRVFVADQVNDRVQQFDQQGDYVRQFGSAGSGEGQFDFVYPADIETDEAGNLWITDANNGRIRSWHIGRRTLPVQNPEVQDDPMVEVATAGDLVSTLAGEEAGVHVYGHSGELLTYHEDADGKTAYVYDASKRLTKVTLPNGTWGEIKYGATDGRVSSVTVDPAGAAKAKTTSFTYKDQPRSTTVTLPEAPAVTYEIGEDGSVFKWQNAKVPPEFEDIAGTLYDVEGKETTAPIAIGDHNLVIQAYSEEGIASIQIYANGNQLVSEKTCTKGPGVDCKKLPDEWVTYTGSHAPGILNLEIVIQDHIGQVASKRFWVNIPYTPPPPPDQPATPRFADVLRFREAHGLDIDLDPIQEEFQINDRVFDTINDWIQGNPVAVASMERWGAPLRTPEVAEFEYRDSYIPHDTLVIMNWGATQASSAYAGYYVDHSAGGIIYVSLLGSKEQQQALLGSISGALLAPSRVKVAPNTPVRTQVQLGNVRAGASTEAISNPQLSEIGDIHIDVPANRVVIASADPAKAESILGPKFGNAIQIIQGGAPVPRPAKYSRYNSDGPVQAGDILGNFETSCSAGFGAWDTVDGKAKNNGQAVYVALQLTAGHCFSKNSKVKRGFPKEVDLGKVTRNNYVEDPAQVSLDAETIKSTWPEVGRSIFVDKNQEKAVTGYETPVVGQWVCVSGVTTDKRVCGPVLDEPKEILSGSEDGTSTLRSIEIPVGARVSQGDSGGPAWIMGTGKAAGIITGAQGGAYGYPECTDLQGGYYNPETDENYICPIVSITTVQQIATGAASLYNAAKLASEGLPFAEPLYIGGVTIGR